MPCRLLLSGLYLRVETLPDLAGPVVPSIDEGIQSLCLLMASGSDEALLSERSRSLMAAGSNEALGSEC